MRLAAQNTTVATLEAELETARGRIQTLERMLKELEQRMEKL
jgi:chaperonin cofactor prefoldin